jgi:2-polyprenyl-3-methyl-5-hydroxy-6-metoxy-1,4-benzoquinol methylase
VLANLLMESQEAARQVPRGDLLLTVCITCGFVFNSAFEACRRYNERYDNSQAHAPTFERYVSHLASYLLKNPQIQHGHIVEIGCGDGAFLRRLIELGCSNTGTGFDPAYRGPTSALDGRLQFVPCYYDETCGNLAADALICRHVIEHIHRPIPFLRLLHQAVATSPHAHVFFETPDITWIFQQRVMWDLYYEHCVRPVQPKLAA